MKKLISTSAYLLFMVSVVVSAQCCSSATADNSNTEKRADAVNQQTDEIEVYYFHATRRCATCEAVEAEAKEAITEYYGDKVAFKSINKDEEKDNPLLKKYKISGQTFIIVNGDKTVDLTNDAFLNARTNPDKFKSKIKSTIDSML